MLEERGLKLLSIKITVLTFVVKKDIMKLSGLSVFLKNFYSRRIFKVNLVLGVFLVLESIGFYLPK